MSRPPLKAFEAVKQYCKSNVTCRGCPLRRQDLPYDECDKKPCSWKITGYNFTGKEGEEK